MQKNLPMERTFKALSLGFQDALSPRNLSYFFYSVLIVVGTLALLYFALSGVISDLLVTIDSSEGGLFWITGVVIHALLGVLGYFLLTPLILIVFSLFSERIFNGIRQQRYASLEECDSVAVTASLQLMGKTFVSYLLLLLIFSPTLLLGVGYLIYFVLGYLLFRRLLLLEVLGIRQNMEQLEPQMALGGEGRYRLTTLLLFLLTLVPVANLFVPYMALCVIANESMMLEMESSDV